MLTKQQSKLYNFLKDKIQKTNVSPSFEEMKNAMGLKSKSDTLNIETDIIGKYVERLLSFDAEETEMDVGILKAIRHLQYGES